MDCETKLALVAVITGLRRSGTIDKRAVKAISEVLVGLANKSQAHCGKTAEGLMEFAAMLDQGPSKSCYADTPKEFFDALLAEHAPLGVH